MPPLSRANDMPSGGTRPAKPSLRQPRGYDKTATMFLELQAWCAMMDAVGPTPRLIVDREAIPGTIGRSEKSEGGPTVRMHPETVSKLQRWLDEIPPLLT